MLGVAFWGHYGYFELINPIIIPDMPVRSAMIEVDPAAGSAMRKTDHAEGFGLYLDRWSRS